MTQSTPDNWNHILTLMATIMLTDKQVSKNEFQSFIENTRQMAAEIDPAMDMSDDLLIEWFKAKHADITAQISGPTADLFIVDNIMALEAFTPKQALLNCLINISAADEDLDSDEVNVVNLAAAYWGLSPIRAI